MRLGLVRKSIMSTICLLGVCFFIMGAGASFAAEGGARPISMGGAFIAIADDAHAVSWNPAGMAWQDDFEITYSGILNNRDKYVSGDFISDDYLSLCSPIKNRAENNGVSRGALGLAFHKSGYTYGGAETSFDQTVLAYGKQMFSDNCAVGISANYYALDVKIPGKSDNDTALSLNLGFLCYLNEKITLGLLWENINEPKYSIFHIKNRLVRNLRPGIAYYFGEDTLISLDIYDLTGNTEDRGSDFSQNICLGFEHYLNKDVSVRMGAHHPNSDVDSSKFYSFGMGWQRSDFLGIYPVSYYLDYALVYWQDPPSGVDDLTHQIGITLKF